MVIWVNLWLMYILTGVVPGTTCDTSAYDVRVNEIGFEEIVVPCVMPEIAVERQDGESRFEAEEREPAKARAGRR